MERELFEKAPIAKAYLKLALPVVFSMVLNVVYNMADTWFISLTGDPNLVAGVSVCSPVFVLSIAMGDIWGLGGRVQKSNTFWLIFSVFTGILSRTLNGSGLSERGNYTIKTSPDNPPAGTWRVLPPTHKLLFREPSPQETACRDLL